MADYKNLIPHIDIGRSHESVDIGDFIGFSDLKIFDFLEDIENDNDSIELHLIKSISYKQMAILALKRAENYGAWRDFLKEEQKTFGGSKMFYINRDCSRVMVLSLPNELPNKIRMVISRINRINEKIGRINSHIRKENSEMYNSRIKSKDAADSRDEIINLINQNLKV